MSSLVVDTNVLARSALGDLQSADDIGPALERLRAAGGGAPGPADGPSLAMSMVASPVGAPIGAA